jgi:hypothetical protein
MSRILVFSAHFMIRIDGHTAQQDGGAAIADPRKVPPVTEAVELAISLDVATSAMAGPPEEAPDADGSGSLGACRRIKSESKYRMQTEPVRLSPLHAIQLTLYC